MQKTGAQNQNARPVKKQLETLLSFLTLKFFRQKFLPCAFCSFSQLPSVVLISNVSQRMIFPANILDRQHKVFHVISICNVVED